MCIKQMLKFKMNKNHNKMLIFKIYTIAKILTNKTKDKYKKLYLIECQNYLKENNELFK